MSNVRYSNARRLALAVERDAALVASRADYTEAMFRDEFAESLVGDDIELTSGLRPVAEYFPAWKRGDVMNAHRPIIAAAGALA